MPPRIHFGINTCFAVKRWPEPERWIAIIREELGLTECQVSLDLLDPLLDERAVTAYTRRVRAAAEAQRLTIHSTFTGLAAYSWSQLLHPEADLRAAAVAWYTRAIDMTAELGAHGTGGHIGAFSAQDAAIPARRELLLVELRAHLQGLARHARQRGLNFLLFENMAVGREWGHSLEEARWLLDLPTEGAGEGVPLVLCLDVGHPCALHTGTPSDDYRAWLREQWQRPPVVHLQQTDRSGDHHWPFTSHYNASGIIRAEHVLDAIGQWGAEDVYLFLEPIHPFEADEVSVLDDLRESVHYWRQAIADEATR